MTYQNTVAQTELTDAFERDLAARQADRISRPIDFRRLARAWGRARRGIRGSLPHDRAATRLTQLTLGLLVYGISEALMIAPSVGVDPWDVFHTGLSRITGIPVGTVLVLIGGVVLLLWIPLRQLPGIGTVANIFVIGIVVDLLLDATPVPHAFPLVHVTIPWFARERRASRAANAPVVESKIVEPKIVESAAVEPAPQPATC